MNCTGKDTYSHQGICCKRCPAGQYVKVHCNGIDDTICANCKDGYYTAAVNYLSSCQVCNGCSHPNHRKVKNCTTTRDTECECDTGFYCSNDSCDHCQRLHSCPAGEGVKVPANRTRNVICAPCEAGTYSNVTDFLSPCKAHTKCEALGLTQKTPGTKEENAVCGGAIPRCSWILPAGLWAGLVLTALILFAFVICRRAKRRSYRAAMKASPMVPVTLVEMVPAAKVTSIDLSLPSIEGNGHCQESCPAGDCKLPFFTPDDNLVNCSVDSSLPITPLKVSVSFAESHHNNGTAGYCTNSFLRTYSEPQEDEWCGT